MFFKISFVPTKLFYRSFLYLCGQKENRYYGTYQILQRSHPSLGQGLLF